MGTHAQIGIKYSDGTISGCYVHWDGSTIERRLRDYLLRYTTTGLAVLIAQAQAVGGINSFHCPTMRSGSSVDETELHDQNEPWVIDENSWEEYNCGAQRYRYLVDYETGEISMTGEGFTQDLPHDEETWD
jgi:hypothetical protein